MIFELTIYHKLSSLFFAVAITIFTIIFVSQLSGSPKQEKETRVANNLFTPVVEKPIKRSQEIKKEEVIEKKTLSKSELLALNLPSMIGTPYSVDVSGKISLSDDLKKDMVSSISDNKVEVFAQGMVEKVPEVIFKPKMTYPGKARSEGIEGSVTLKILVESSGNIKEVIVLESDPPGVFEAAAVSDIKRWRFKPGIHKGKEVSVWVIETVTYKLR